MDNKKMKPVTGELVQQILNGADSYPLMAVDAALVLGADAVKADGIPPDADVGTEEALAPDSD